MISLSYFKDKGLLTKTGKLTTKASEEDKTLWFVYRAILAHGKIYSYDKCIYKRSDAKVTITCPEHGGFEQTPKNHLKGCGCTSCGKTVSSVLYLWGIKGTSVYKIGVSTPERLLDRISQVARSNCVEAEDVYYKDLEEDAKPLEHSLHLELSDKKVILLEGDGRQETFLLKPEAVAQIKIKIGLLRMAFQGIIVT